MTDQRPDGDGLALIAAMQRYPACDPANAYADELSRKRQHFIEGFKAGLSAATPPTRDGAEGAAETLYRRITLGDGHVCYEPVLALFTATKTVEPPYIELPLTFWYKNHRGEESLRTAFPIGIRFGTAEWHPEAQWLLRAFDRDKQAEREFAMRDMLAAPPKPAPDAIIAEVEGWKYENPKGRMEIAWNAGLDERIRDLAIRRTATPVPPNKDFAIADQWADYSAACDKVRREMRALVLERGDPKLSSLYYRAITLSEHEAARRTLLSSAETAK